MALDDILQAIKAHADRELADARTAHAQRVVQMREASQREIERKEREITEQKDEKLKHLRQKADAYVTSHIRNASLQAKQNTLNDVYAAVAETLAALPEARVHALLKACVDALPSKGEIRPAKAHAALLAKIAGDRYDIGEPIDAAGGFIFTSKERDVDCTFDTLIERVLRPATELDTSVSLFGA